MSIWWKSILGRMTMAFMEDTYHVGWGDEHPEETVSIWHPYCIDGKSKDGWLPVSIYAIWGQGMVEYEYNHLMYQLDDAGIPRARSCKECRSFDDDQDYNEYSGETYHCYECRRFPKYSNLRSFPFQNAQKLKCFIPAFWSTPYARLWSDDKDAARAAYYREFPKAEAKV